MIVSRPGRNRIKGKLTTLLLAGNSLMLLALTLGFISYEFYRCRDERTRELATLGDVAAGRLSAPVAAGDPESVLAALSAFSGVPRIGTVRVVNSEGTLLAQYGPKAADGAGIPPSPLGFPSVRQQVSRPIFSGRGTVGVISLTSEENLTPQFVFALLLLLGAALGSALLAWLHSRRIRRLICDPIGQLTQKMEIVSRCQDYQVRVKSWSDDELGLLFDCFNEMLAEISIRDERLALHSEELKLEVAERTEELYSVNRQLAESLDGVSSAMQAAQSANRAKSDFLAQMSHEIRTPMYGVLGMTELLQNTHLTKKQSRLVDTVRRSGEALLAIINDILDFSKIEAGRLELEVIPFDLHDLVADTVAMFFEDAGKKGLLLTLQVSPEVPRPFMGDPGRLRQVMVNLLANAVKFTTAGSVRLTVSMQRKPNLVRISISDTGIGIAPEAQARIFEQFSQGDESMTRRYGGTGLGLAIVRQLTELMGGELELTSQPGKGSTFSFTASLDCAAGQEWVPLRGRRVLVACESPATREALLGQLTGWGMEVESACDAPGALRMLVQASYDLLIVDQHLAGTDGLELAVTVRALPAGRALRLVLLTDAEPDGQSERARDAGVVIFSRMSLSRYGLYWALLGALGLEQPCEDDGAGPDPFRRPPHVLLVEDNLVNQEVGKGMLESLGCKVVLLDNGLSAVEAVQRTSYDMVFMDCQMPELDGLQATRRIRAREASTPGSSRVPIIALTAYAMKGDRLACLDSGADDYLSKPFTIKELSRLIGRHLQGPCAEPSRADAACVDAPCPQPQAPPRSRAPEAISREKMTGALEMIRLLPGNRGMEILRKVVDLYLASTPTLMQTMREAESVKDAEKLKIAAHSFKSSSANLGAMRLAGVCHELETLGRAGSTEGALPLLMQAEEEYRVVREALQGGSSC